jgi:hypothetical protein
MMMPTTDYLGCGPLAAGGLVEGGQRADPHMAPPMMMPSRASSKVKALIPFMSCWTGPVLGMALKSGAHRTRRRRSHQAWKSVRSS